MTQPASAPEAPPQTDPADASTDASTDASQDGSPGASPESGENTSDRQPRPLVTVSCYACGSDAHEPASGAIADDEHVELQPPAFRALRFQFVRCTDCGLVYLRDRPDLRDLDVYYGEAYKCFESYRDRGAIMYFLAQRVARGKLKLIEELMPAGNDVLLDYGCGAGTWLDLIKGMGCDYRMIGTDITEGPLEELRQRGVEAHCCDERGLFEHVERGSVGVIHMFHVIEHVPDVKGVLRVLYDALAPGGALIGQTPNVASTGRWLFGDLWNQLHPPRHLLLFDHQTLRREAEEAGFEVRSISSSLSGATQWALSALRGWAQWRGRPYRQTHEPLYPPLIFACLPFTVLECAFSHACHMDFVFVKPTDGGADGS